MTTTTNYGPQTEQILALIDRAGRLTEAEARDLHAARDWRGVYAARDAEREMRSGLQVATWNAAADRLPAAQRMQEGPWTQAWEQAAAEQGFAAAGHFAHRNDGVSIDGVGRMAADAAVRSSGYYLAAPLAADAAFALVVRHLVGRYPGYQEHYDVLTMPWRAVIGPIHPDDAPATAPVAGG